MKPATRMFRTLGLTAAIVVAGLGTTQAQTVSWDPRTGDVWVDTWLGDINRYGNRYQQPFVDEMVRYYGAPRDLVTDLLLEREWAPGDVYYACAIAQVIGRPCRYVADQWERHDRQEGWGALAQRLGIKPGSAEFHRLKRGFVSSYDRWGRPIRIDDDLFEDYPERARVIRESRNNGNGHRDDRGNRDTPAARGNDAAANRGNRGNGGRGNADDGRGNQGKGSQGKGNRGNGGDQGKGRGGNGQGRGG